MGAGYQKAMIIRLELDLQSPAPCMHSLERGEGLEVEYIIDHAHETKPP